MDSKDRDEHSQPKNEICRLEWIALAMDAARRYKEAEHLRRADAASHDDGESD